MSLMPIIVPSFKKPGIFNHIHSFPNVIYYRSWGSEASFEHPHFTMSVSLEL